MGTELKSPTTPASLEQILQILLKELGSFAVELLEQPQRMSQVQGGIENTLCSATNHGS